MKKILVLFIDSHKARVFNTWQEVHRATWSPAIGQYRVVPLTAQGQCYQQRKESVESLADLYKEYGYRMLDNDRSKMYVFFKKYGKRYGLTKDLEAMGII